VGLGSSAPAVVLSLQLANAEVTRDLLYKKLLVSLQKYKIYISQRCSAPVAPEFLLA